MFGAKQLPAATHRSTLGLDLLVYLLAGDDYSVLDMSKK